MKSYKKIFRITALTAGLVCLIAVLLFAKVWISDRNSLSAAAGYDAEAVAGEAEYTGTVPDSATGEAPDIAGTPNDTTGAPTGTTDIPADTTGPLTDIASTPTGIPTDMTGTPFDMTGTSAPLATSETPYTTDIIGLETAYVTTPEISAGNDLYSVLLDDFAQKALEPLGLSLVSCNFTPANESYGQSLALLYFSGGDKMSYENKKLAAVKLAQFIYGEFEQNSNFKTDYLKVHLKQPEGESFALPRGRYMEWAAGGSEEDLFRIMADQITPDQKITDPGPQGETFQATMLEDYLNGLSINGLHFKVEGGATKVDPGIYIAMDKYKDDLGAEEYEDTVIQLCREVFRAYFKKSGQPVAAFKLIEPSGNVPIVVYRETVDALWPEGTGSDALRRRIRDGNLPVP